MSSTAPTLTPATSKIAQQRRKNTELYDEVKVKINQEIYTLDENQPQGKSPAWNCFRHVLDENKVKLQNIFICIVCKKIQKQSSKSTSNLVNHTCVLNSKLNQHTDVPLTQVNAMVKNQSTVAFTKWIVQNNLPVSILTTMESLIEFYIEVGQTHSSKIDVKSLIPQCNIVNTNIAKLKTVHDDSITTDLRVFATDGCGATANLWNDEEKSYLGVTVSFVKDKKLVDYALAVQTFEDASADILQNTTKIFQNYGVENFDDKIVLVINSDLDIDPASDNKKTLTCISSLINRVFNDAIIKSKEVCDVLEKVKNIEIHLMENCNQMSLKPYYSQKWYGYIDMMNKICEKWDSLEIILSECGKSNLKIGIEKVCISKLKESFVIFKEVLTSLEDYHSVTLHKVYPYLDALKLHCKLDPSDFALLKEFKMELLNGINTQIIPNLMPEHKAAIFLFPPANTLTVFTEPQKENTYDFVKLKMASFRTPDTNSSITISQPESSPTISQTTCSDLWLKMIRQNYFQTGSIDPPDQVETEFHKYQNETFNHLPAELDLLAWWDLRKNDFPLLYRVSKAILSIPASTAANNRLFCKTRSFLNDNLFETSSKNLNDSLVMHSNLKNDFLKEILSKIIPE
jgi:hypothetical protein